MTELTIAGAPLAVYDEGAGTPLVLLHGFCEDSSIWEPYFPVLSENFRVVRIDLPGFGNSPARANCSIADMADLVAEAWAQLELPAGVLIGHSMGGYAAVAFAKKYSDRLLGLGMFHSQPFEDTPEKKAGRQKGIDFIKQHGTVLFVKQLIPNLFAPNFPKSNRFLIERLTLQAIQYPAAGIINGLQAMKDRPDNSEVLKQVSCPVLFIIGKEDTAIPPTASVEQTHLPDVADIHILERIGHMGMWEAKRDTLRIVRKFVEDCQSR